MQRNDSLTIYVCHSFDDDSRQSSWFQKQRYVHIDIRDTPFNEYANEATAVFAIDQAGISDDGFYGLCHYRRFIQFEDSELSPSTILCTSDKLGMSIFKHFHACHCIDYFQQFCIAFTCMHGQKWKDECAFLEKHFNDSKQTFYSRNIFVAAGSLFKEWLAYVRDCIDVNHALYKLSSSSPIWDDKYQKRQPAFVIERMTSLWLYTKQQQGYKLDIKPYMTLDIDSPYQRA